MKPELREYEAAWQLRTEWARQREVVLVVRSRDVPRVRGYVQHVAATSSFALLWTGRGLTHVPCTLVRAVRSPHMHEQGDGPQVARPPPREPFDGLPGQLVLFDQEMGRK